MKYCKPELSFFIFTSYERSECFIFGVKRKMLHNEVASSSGVFYEAFCGDAAKYEAHLAMHEAALRAMKQSLTASFRHFFGQKNGGRRGIRTLGELPLGGFQDRCLKPLDHSSAL